MGDDLFVVKADRWGSAEKHSYIVGAATREVAALRLAEAEHASRGGKYGVEVLAFYDGQPGVGAVVAYYPSRFGEDGAG